MESAIVIKNLSKIYSNKFCALKSLTLDVKKGEMVGFVGRNGAGKSTTIRCMLNQITPTTGSVTILGLDSKKNNKEIKEFTSFVPSEIAYYPGLRVKDIIDYTIGFSKNSNKEIVDSLYEYLEISPSRKIDELSLGNRKKVSIIQALVKNPKVIILDEPTSGLDPLIQEKLFHLLMEQKKKGTAILLSSHNLSEVEKYCDRVAIIKDGNLLEVSEVSKFKKENVYNVSYSKNGKENALVWNGKIRDLMQKLNDIEPDDLQIVKPSIEEEFMKYYEKQ